MNPYLFDAVMRYLFLLIAKVFIQINFDFGLCFESVFPSVTFSEYVTIDLDVIHFISFLG